jgi:hypothetical protein
VVLGGDKVLNGVQESTAMMTVCSKILKVSCNDGNGRLED